MMGLRGLLHRFYLFSFFQRAVYRWGPAYWRLNRTLRKRIAFQRSYRRLAGALIRPYGVAEMFRLPRPVGSRELPTLGHRLAARRQQLPQPQIATLDRAWLVGRHAAVVSRDGRLLLSAFANKASVLGLEPNEDLVAFLESKGCAQPDESRLKGVVPLVGRLDPNYFHWIVETCGSLEGLLDDSTTFANLNFVIRCGGPAYQRESLELLGIPAASIVERPDEAMPWFVTDVSVPCIPGSFDACSPRSLRWLRARFQRSALSNVGHVSSLPLRIYVPRRRGGWRSVLNDDEVAAAMERQGFMVFRSEEHSLTEQIRIFARATMVVGLHGAGLTNTLFARDGRLLELIGSYGDGHMYSIAAGLGMPYASLRCENRGDDVVVNVEHLLRDVSKLEGVFG